MNFEELVKAIPWDKWEYEVVITEQRDEGEYIGFRYTIDDDKQQIILEGLMK